MVAPVMLESRYPVLDVLERAVLEHDSSMLCSCTTLVENVFLYRN